MRRSASHCFCINLRRAAGAISDFYDRALSEAQLTTSQFSLMRTLSRLQPCTVTALAQEMGLERTTLVRTMKPLSERELIADLVRSRRERRTQGGGSSCHWSEAYAARYEPLRDVRL